MAHDSSPHLLRSHKFKNLILILLYCLSCSSEKILSTYDIFWLSLLPNAKLPIDQTQIFSQSSDLTLVITTCNNINLLSTSLHSFFHYNTHPLRKVIIIDDCSSNQEQIWNLIPVNHVGENQFFKVIASNARMGLIGTLDQAYSFVESKYVYFIDSGNLEQLTSYGLIEKMKDVLNFEEKMDKKVSQILFSLPQDPEKEFHLSENEKTDLKTQFFKVNYANNKNSFTFKPHLLNIQKVYKEVLGSSLTSSIAKKYSCLNGEAIDTSCTIEKLGSFLSSLNYSQIFLQTEIEEGAPKSKHSLEEQNLDFIFSKQDTFKPKVNKNAKFISDVNYFKHSTFIYVVLLFLSFVTIGFCVFKSVRLCLMFESENLEAGSQKIASEDPQVVVLGEGERELN